MIHTVTTIHELRSTLLPWRRAGETIGFVSTMGTLHEGHLKLVEASRKTMGRTIVCIFANSLQFGPNEEMAKFPRQFEADRKLLTDAGADLLYAPAADEIYPNGFATKINPGPMAKTLEGAVRPGHFTGMATIVTKMFLQVMPDAAFFGEKDYQQLLIVRRLARDLDIPVQIIGVPTVRDKDGLALSNRNSFLTPEDRTLAAAIPQIILETASQILEGTPIDTALKVGEEKFRKKGFEVDYLELANAETLAPMRDLDAKARLLAAVRVGTTRLIDNMPVDKY